MKRKMIISEPWNFESNQGINILLIDVYYENDDYKLATVISKCEYENKKIILKKRNKFDYDIATYNKIDFSDANLILIGGFYET